MRPRRGRREARFAEVIDPSPENPAPNPVRNACRLTLASRLWRFFLPIALVFGFFGPAAAQAFRPSTTDFAPNSAPSWRHGWAFASGTGDGSARLWNVADAAIAAGVSSALRSGEPDPPRLVALVIANGAYPDAPLQNPVIDAGLVGESFKRIGFAVTLKTNVDLDGFEQALSDFAEASKGADVALFYFAGHGFSVAADGIQQNLPDDDVLQFSGEVGDCLEAGRRTARPRRGDDHWPRARDADLHRRLPQRPGARAPWHQLARLRAAQSVVDRRGLRRFVDPSGQDGRGRRGGPRQSVRARFRRHFADSGIADRRRGRAHPQEGAGRNLRRPGSRRRPQRSSGRRRGADADRRFAIDAGRRARVDPANGCSDGRFGVKGDRLPGSDSAGGVEIRAAAARGRTARFRDDSRRPRAKDRSE